MHHPRLRANPLASRADLRRALLDLWQPLQPYLEHEDAAISLGANEAGYGQPGRLLEAFTRPLWGLVSLHAGGADFPHWPLYQHGLAAGVNPRHPHYWGEAGDHDQRFVEMAVLGLGLVCARDRLWDPLPEKSRVHLVAWLSQINTRRLPDNNWRFFRVFTNLGLKAVGAPSAPALVEEDLDCIDGCYQGDGWYTDGKGPQRDYYIPMAIHFYGLLLAGLPGALAPDRAARFRERARRFAADFAAWFAADGSAIPIGRSLTYRFAQGAFWGALAFAGEEALPWGVIKGLHLRHLRWWLRQPVFTGTGVLTLGYGYPNLIVSEGYNAPGSPYWACKAFLPLALPEEHPFWQAEELPCPVPSLSVQPGAGLILCRDESRDHVVALSSNQVPSWPLRHAASKYPKFAYSNAFGFGVPAGGSAPEWGGADGMLMLSDDGRDWRGRETLLDERYPGATLYTRWSPWPDVEVETWLTPVPPGHLRVHRVVTGRPLQSVEGGFAVSRLRETPTDGDGARAHTGFFLDHAQGFSGVRDLAGERRGRAVETEPNTNVLHPLVSVPVLEGAHPAGECRLFTAVAGLPGEGHGEAGRTFLDSLRLQPGPAGPQLWRADTLLLDNLSPR